MVSARTQGLGRGRQPARCGRLSAMSLPKLRRGQIVLVDFGGRARIRPALVVQNDRDNQRLTNVIVVQVTSNVSRSHEPTQILVDQSHGDWQISGLRRPSVVNCSNIAYVRQADIAQVIGSLSDATMQQV